MYEAIISAQKSLQKSNYYGVFPSKSKTLPWIAKIIQHGQWRFLGDFASEEEAARAFDRKARTTGLSLKNFAEDDDSVPSCAPDAPPSDLVNHPSHYTSHPSGVECIDVVEWHDFVIGNIIKYAWRAGLKNGTSKLDDLKKCAWYAQRAVEREEKHGKTN